MWLPSTTSPTVAGEYQVGWYRDESKIVAFEMSGDYKAVGLTPAAHAAFVQQVDTYDPVEGWGKFPTQVQYWQPLGPAPGPPAAPVDICTALAELLAALGFAVVDVSSQQVRTVTGTWRSDTGATYSLEYTWGSDSPAHATCVLWLTYPSGAITMLFTAQHVGTLAQAMAQLVGNVRFFNAYRDTHPDVALY